MAKGWVLSTGNLPRGGFPRNSVDRITDRPDMTSAVDRGHKALTQSNPNLCGASIGRREENLYNWSRSHDQDGSNAHL